MLFLLIVLSTTIVALNSCSQDDAGSEQSSNSPTSDRGVVINGVKWATRNVDKPGTFAAKPEDAGMFYQWNRKVAWPTTGDITGWDNSTSTGTAWEKSNDPSPAGWCVPTSNEIIKLLDTNKVSNEWTIQNGVNGRKFTDKDSGNTLFLPAVGYRFYSDGMLDDVGTYGTYWSSTQGNIDNADGLAFNIDNVNRSNIYRAYGFSVRCVAEK